MRVGSGHKTIASRLLSACIAGVQLNKFKHISTIGEATHAHYEIGCVVVV